MNIAYIEIKCMTTIVHKDGENENILLKYSQAIQWMIECLKTGSNNLKMIIMNSIATS